MLYFFFFSPPSDAYLVMQPTSPPPKRQAHSLKAVIRIDGSHHEIILLNHGIYCPKAPLLAKALEVRPTVLQSEPQPVSPLVPAEPDVFPEPSTLTEGSVVQPTKLILEKLQNN